MRGRPTVLIAGGGTGGHVFPGLAIAEAFAAISDVEVFFAGTQRGLEARVIPERGYELLLFDVSPIKGGGIFRAVRGAFAAGRAALHGYSALRRRRPSVVVSIGGYASGPVSLAAAALGVAVVIVEPNSVLGLANRLLAPMARRAYVAWDETARRIGPKARTLGVPIRSGFVPRPYRPGATRSVLVLGGSQGAGALNERLPDAIVAAAIKVPGLDVVHQTGADRADAVRAAYAALGFSRVEVLPFIGDMPAALARADLVVARAGASTLAELAAVGRASILIPFPHAADDHQARNARALERAGGAVCIRQEAADTVRLSVEIQRLLVRSEERAKMADAARSTGKPHAAELIARDLLDLMGAPAAQVNGTAVNGEAS